jgi:antitoxin CcdA
MPNSGIPDPKTRRATNVTLPVALVALAKELNVNISQACETGLAAQVREARAAKWLAENRGAIEAYNKWIEENGVPLSEYRSF